MAKYKNISEQTQVLIGIGEVEAGAIIETDKEINNPNFELVEEGKRFVGVDPVTKKGK